MLTTSSYSGTANDSTFMSSVLGIVIRIQFPNHIHSPKLMEARQFTIEISRLYPLYLGLQDMERNFLLDIYMKAFRVQRNQQPSGRPDWQRRKQEGIM